MAHRREQMLEASMKLCNHKAWTLSHSAIAVLLSFCILGLHPRLRQLMDIDRPMIRATEERMRQIWRNRSPLTPLSRAIKLAYRPKAHSIRNIKPQQLPR